METDLYKITVNNVIKSISINEKPFPTNTNISTKGQMLDIQKYYPNN